jgi:hypothetical protein
MIKQILLLGLLLIMQLSCINEKKNSQQVLLEPQKDSSQTAEITKFEDSVIGIMPRTKHEAKKLAVVYVTAVNGLICRKSPRVSSKELVKFELGAKLSVIDSTGLQFEIKEGHKTISGEWIKVVSHKKYRPYTGYVFSGFVVDSATADFSKVPIDVSYQFDFLENSAQIDFNEIDLKFSPSTFTEFNKYDKINNTAQNSSSLIKPLKIVGNPQIGGYFIIDVNNRLYKFPCGKSYSRPCYIYQGYDKHFNAYVIGQLGEGIYETFYLDKDDGSFFRINSPYDNGNYNLFTSPSKKRLVSTSSIDYQRFQDFYGARSVITIYDIEGIQSFIDIKKAFSYETGEWEISGLNWIDDKSFIIEVYDKTTTDEKGRLIPTDTHYLKITLY